MVCLAIRFVVFSGIACVAADPSIAWEDGATPTAPYRFLHPPPALRRVNKPPASASKTVTLKHGKNPTGFVLFPSDGQAGLGAHAGAFSAPSPARQIVFRISPVNQPARLPHHLQLDGNAYRFDAISRPGNRPVSIHQQLGLVLRWPYLPRGIYVYGDHHWHLVCDARHWQRSQNLVVCHTRTLGIFAAAHVPASKNRQ